MKNFNALNDNINLHIIYINLLNKVISPLSISYLQANHIAQLS